MPYDPYRPSRADDAAEAVSPALFNRGVAGAVRFEAGAGCCDIICGFVPGRHRLVFAPGFFGAGAAGADIWHRLRVFNAGPRRAVLAADTAGSGWRCIAEFMGLEAETLREAIADGTALAVNAPTG